MFKKNDFNVGVQNNYVITDCRDYVLWNPWIRIISLDAIKAKNTIKETVFFYF